VTRKLTLIIAMTLLAALVGCTPDAKETPTPEATVYTPVPSPTPSWSTEEQGAIDAVQKYIAVWTDISQNLQTADWNGIRDVASDPAANNAVILWSQWRENGWHLVGSPTLEVDRVDEGATDAQGTRYHVHGCYITSGSSLSDMDGNPLTKQGADRSTGNYLVLHQMKPQDTFYVLDDVTEGDPC